MCTPFEGCKYIKVNFGSYLTPFWMYRDLFSSPSTHATYMWVSSSCHLDIEKKSSLIWEDERGGGTDWCVRGSVVSPSTMFKSYGHICTHQKKKKKRTKIKSEGNVTTPGIIRPQRRGLTINTRTHTRTHTEQVCVVMPLHIHRYSLTQALYTAQEVT